MKTLKLFTTILAFGAMTFVSSATAAPINIIFDNQANEPGGTVSFGSGAPGAAAFVLTGGAISLVSREDNAASFAVSGTCGESASLGCINFSTGLLTQDFGNVKIYGPGGSLTITGTAGPASGTLYQTALGFDVSTLAIDAATNTGSFNGLLRAGALDPVLADLLNVDDVSPGGTATNLSIRVTFGVNSGTGEATINGIQISPEDFQDIPEPGSMFLMSTGLIGFVVAARRRAAAKK